MSLTPVINPSHSNTYHRELLKKLDTAMVYSGIRGKLIHEKPEVENLVSDFF